MDLRIHFDRPADPIELEIENNACCILSSLGTKLKQVRLDDNGRWINIRVNSKTYLKPIKNSKGMPAIYGSTFDVNAYKSLPFEDKKTYLLNWIVSAFHKALDQFTTDGVDNKTSRDLAEFMKECSFRTRYNGKWAKLGEQRARVVVYQSFEKADVHIETKYYRSRTSSISPVLAHCSPSEFALQIYLKEPEIGNDGEWVLSKWSVENASSWP